MTILNKYQKNYGILQILNIRYNKNNYKKIFNF